MATIQSIQLRKTSNRICFFLATLIFSVTIFTTCSSGINKENKVNNATKTIDTNFVINTSNFINKVYYEDGFFDIFRLYSDSSERDVFRFGKNGRLLQYVFLVKEVGPKFIVDYDTAGQIVSYKGKSIVFKSLIFGKTIHENAPYRIEVYGATPPLMNLNIHLYLSADNINWKNIANYSFSDSVNTLAFESKAIKSEKFGKIVAQLIYSDNEKQIMHTDSAFYQVNIID